MPANLFVAEFIGSPPMNLLTGELGVQNGHSVFFGNGMVLALGSVFGSMSVRRRIHIGIRPEEIELVAPQTGLLDATIEMVEHLGSELVVIARAQGKTLSKFWRRQQNRSRPAIASA